MTIPEASEEHSATESQMGQAPDMPLILAAIKNEPVGRGAQYTVYPLDEDRVYKVPNTMEQAEEIIRAWNSPHYSSAEEISGLARETAELRDSSAARLCDLAKTDAALAASLGNPKLLDDGSLIQDRATPLVEALEQATPEEAREIIDKYARLIQFHWGYGFSETVFHFSINNGLSSSGEVVLFDFGEVSFDRQTVEDGLVGGAWQHNLSVEKHLSEDAREYYLNAMPQQINSDSLAQLWGQRGSQA